MLTKFKIFLLLLLLQMPLAYAAQKPVEQLQSFLTATHTLSANFKQVVYDERGKVKQTSFGVFHLSRPGKFRWNYQKPFVQEIVSNNGKVWFYDADLEQVTIKKLDKSMGSTPALLLTGDVELEKEFTLEDQGFDEGLQWVKLIPKNPDSNFKYVLLGLTDTALAGMELSDHFGQLTRVYFSDVRINPPISPSEFNFIPPKGVDVLEDKEQEKPKLVAPVKETFAEEPVPATEPVKTPPVEIAPVETMPVTPITPVDVAPVEPAVEEAVEFEDAAPVATTRHKTKQPAVHHHDKAKSATADKAKDKDKGKSKTKDKADDKGKTKVKDKSKDKKDKSTDKPKSKDKPREKKSEKHDSGKSKEKSKEKTSKDKHSKHK